MHEERRRTQACVLAGAEVARQRFGAPFLTVLVHWTSARLLVWAETYGATTTSSMEVEVGRGARSPTVAPSAKNWSVRFPARSPDRSGRPAKSPSASVCYGLSDGPRLRAHRDTLNRLEAMLHCSIDAARPR